MTENSINGRQKIILISDIWGKEKSDWVNYYTDILGGYFELKYYDACKLGSVEKADYSIEKLHHQFINGGISKAVESIVQKETEAINILGFSVGGVIAWKAGLNGLNASNIFAISSTRLRYETEKPPAEIALFFGENDVYKPNAKWFRQLRITENLFNHEGHELYKKQEIAERVCSLIIKKLLPSI